jgi:predicted RNA-binding Zn-ribbon protein involved in translation (DUF1610 family)
MPRARRSQARATQKRRTQAKPKVTAKRSGSAEFKCPECGKTFSRAAALGAHRSRIHGVAGSSRAARASSRDRQRRTPVASTAPARAPGASRRAGRSSNGAQSEVNRDTLLQALFPNGLPAREAIIREANNWLDQAERLALMK